MKSLTKKIRFKPLCFVAVLSVFGLCYSQQNPSELQFTNYQLFFDQPQEEIFLDLPKNTFFIDEPIKFAGYVFDKIKKLPSEETANVYCNIYDEYGKLVQQELFYANKGKFFGEIKVPSKKGSGKYFIKAYTNWMKNFPEKLMFIQDIYIIDEKFQKESPKTAELNQLTIFPEGGYLISQVNNSVGFHLELHSETPQSYGECFLENDSGQRIVNNIRVNPQGYGKFLFKPEEGTEYTLTLVLENEKTIQKVLPKARKNGLAVQVNPLISENISLEFNCHPEYVDLYKKDPITIAIHRDGNLKLIDYQIRNQKSNIMLPKNEVLPGLNKLSVFDQQQNLLAERIFYNDQNMESIQNKTNVEVIDEQLDSITVSMSVDKLKLGSTAQLSLSVLPNETKARDYHGNLASWLLLNSYFETPFKSEAYLANMSRKHLFDLDLFLLNNQWNRYQWKDPVKLQSDYRFNFDKGISINGQLSGDSSLKNKKLVLYQQSVGEYFSTTIDDKFKFSLKDVFIIKDEPILFFTEGYQIRQYTNVKLTYFPEEEENSLTKNELNRFTHTRNINLQESLSPKFVKFPDNELLDEVVVEANVEPKLTRNPRLMVGVMNGEKLIEKEARTMRLSEYIRKKGFRVFRLLDRNQFLVIPTKQFIDNHPPAVYLNGFRTQYPIHDMPLASVDEFYYHHFSMEYSDSGEIHIYTRTQKAPKDLDAKLLKAVAKVGFNTTTSKNKLKFTEFMKNHFVSFGSVYWNGDIELKKGETIQIKFPTYSLKEFRIYINGFSDKGDIISASKYIAVD